MIWYLHVSLIVSQNSPHSLIFSHVCAQSLSYVQHFATPGTVARQAPLSMGFPRQEHWSGLPFLTPGDLPNPEIKPVSLSSLALVGGILTTAPPWKPILYWPFSILQTYQTCSRLRSFTRYSFFLKFSLH